MPLWAHPHRRLTAPIRLLSWNFSTAAGGGAAADVRQAGAASAAEFEMLAVQQGTAHAIALWVEYYSPCTTSMALVGANGDHLESCTPSSSAAAAGVSEADRGAAAVELGWDLIDTTAPAVDRPWTSQVCDF